MNRLSFILILVIAVSVWRVGQAASTGVPAEAMPADVPVDQSPALALDAFSTLEAILPSLADKRVISIGETHTRYDHHLSQLEIIRRLHESGTPLAIGMEIFQQPFQSALDDYIAGDIEIDEMLRAAEYYQRWRFDFRHYAPILRYAREHGLPVIALNVPTELTRSVGRAGLEGLNDDERRQLPANIAPAGQAYRDRIRTVFDMHPGDGSQSFENFLEAQLLWDEGMAERAAAYLEAYPGHSLVVIAGNQHIAWGSSMPQRLQRRLDVPVASILNSWQGRIGPGLADFLLMPAERSLPPAGKIGVLFDEVDREVIVTACMQEGACAEVDLQSGDRIESIDNADINSRADLRLAMWDKRPGDTVSMTIVRERLLLPDKHLDFELTLK